MKPLEFANLLKPTHCRTSCSDDNVRNGFGSTTIDNIRTKTDEDGVKWQAKRTITHFRCIRCAILHILVDCYTLDAEQKEHLESSSSYDTVLAADRFRKL